MQFCGNSAVSLKVAMHINPMRAKPVGFFDVHRRVDAVFPGFVAAGSHHAPLVRHGADNQGLSLKCRIVPDFHGGVECIHIHMYYNLLHFPSLYR